MEMLLAKFRFPVIMNHHCPSEFLIQLQARHYEFSHKLLLSGESQLLLGLKSDLVRATLLSDNIPVLIKKFKTDQCQAQRVQVLEEAVRKGIVLADNVIRMGEKEANQICVVIPEGVFPGCQPFSQRIFLKGKKQRLRLFRQLVDKVQFLHKRGTCHLQLRMDNIFLSSPVSLGDFPLDINVYQKSIKSSISKAKYLSPQSFFTIFFSSKTVDSGNLAQDIWALGCIFYQLIFQRSLFLPQSMNSHALNIIQLLGVQDVKSSLHMVKYSIIEQILLIHQIKHSQSQPILNRLLQKLTRYQRLLLLGMLKLDPSKRINIAEISAFMQKLLQTLPEQPSQYQDSYSKTQVRNKENNKNNLQVQVSLLSACGISGSLLIKTLGFAQNFYTDQKNIIGKSRFPKGSKFKKIVAADKLQSLFPQNKLTIQIDKITYSADVSLLLMKNHQKSLVWNQEVSMWIPSVRQSRKFKIKLKISEVQQQNSQLLTRKQTEPYCYSIQEITPLINKARTPLVPKQLFNSSKKEPEQNVRKNGQLDRSQKRRALARAGQEMQRAVSQLKSSRKK